MTTPSSKDALSPRILPLAGKVPAVSALFWITKILTTGMGETTSDFVVVAIAPVAAVLIALVLLIVALVVQFRARSYVPWIYWTAVVMVSVFGTMAADVMHIVLGVPYAVSTIAFACALAVIFVVWFAVERTLSIHSITTPRREVFYWAAVLATFALGTATGDWTAKVLHLGYLGSGLLFLGLFVLPALAYRFLALNGIAAFWIAYVLTRPLGASFADWLGVSEARGGVGIGTGLVSLVLAALIAVCVGVMSRQRSAGGLQQFARE